MATLAAIQFDKPSWWLLAIPLVALTLLIARRTLSGSGTAARRTALALRLAVILMVVAALAQPQWRQEAKDVAVTAVLDASRSVGFAAAAAPERVLTEAAKTAEREDMLGLVTATREAYVQVIPRKAANLEQQPLDIKNIGATDATDLEGAVRLAMAVFPQAAGNRILLLSDGNETRGSLLAAAKAAKAAGIPIDVFPRRFSVASEVIVERLIAPATAREGENASVRVVLNATGPARGRLSLLMNGQPVDLDPDSEQISALVELTTGVNVQSVPVRLGESGPVRFEAVYEPVAAAGVAGAGGAAGAGDQIVENNRAMGVTFVGGDGRVLVLAKKAEEAEALLGVLRAANLKAELRAPADGFSSLVDLGAFEGVILINVAAHEFTQVQQEELRAYIRDLGGGMVMVGGPDAFGAGGWIGSPLADALPIKMDPPQKRQMPRGALALIMHSCEMPNGNFWGRRTMEAAVDALSSKDIAGIIEYGPMGADNEWYFPLTVLGDKSAIRRAMNGLTYGDAPSFQTMMQTAVDGLKGVAAGQKHCIIISDGDPAPPTDALLTEFVANKISVSTVAVFPHSWGNASTDLTTMRTIARVTGGQFHEITQQNQLNSLPQIFIKEAQIVRRSLIWEGDAFSPALVNSAAEAMRGIRTPLPPLRGYVVAADREGLSQVILRGQENDPVLAQWQHGLGRVVTFTGDASSRWSPAWLQWSQFRPFWEQHIRWALRPAGSPNVRVVTEPAGDRTKVIVEAVDDKGDRLDFVRWNARVVSPDLSGKPFELRQTGPGRYEAVIDTDASGSYTISMGYDQTTADGQPLRGTVQAAVTRPFADEFRALRDNAALLEQVAALTGGRVLEGNLAQADLWTREGLTMPVSLQPVWLAVTLAAVALFLADVAVRRVRIDPAAILATVRMALGAAKTGTGQQIDSLKAAREKARGRIREREAPVAGATSVPLDPGARSTSGVKFEASAAELAAARRATNFADTIAAPIDVKPAPGAGGPGGAGKPGAAGPDEGMSRLLKAKKRAQQDME